jgi:hypothetical protein
MWVHLLISQTLPKGQFNQLLIFLLHRVSIKSYPDYKHLLQENYVVNLIGCIPMCYQYNLLS